MALPSLAVLITSHSDKGQLTRVLEYAYTQEYDGPLEFLVIDNASKDNSLLVVSSRYPQVQVIKNETNQGIGTALNQALARTEAEYIAVLHQDVETPPTWAATLVQGLLNDERYGAACSLLAYRKAQGNKLIVDTAGIAFRQGRPTRLYEGADIHMPILGEAHQVFGVPGAAAIYRRSMLEKIAVNNEVFDEDLFAWLEDYDIALRASLAGYRAIYLPDEVVVHKRGILRAKDEDLQKQRAILETVNPLLMMYKLLPVSIFEKRKSQMKKEFRKRMFWLGKVFGFNLVLRAYSHYSVTRGKMIKKQRRIFDDLEVKISALDWEVFGKQ